MIGVTLCSTDVVAGTAELRVVTDPLLDRLRRDAGRLSCDRKRRALSDLAQDGLPPLLRCSGDAGAVGCVRESHLRSVTHPTGGCASILVGARGDSKTDTRLRDEELIDVLSDLVWTGAEPASGIPDDFEPTPIDRRLPSPVKFVPANLRHYYTYDLDTGIFTRIEGLTDNDVLRSGVDARDERDTRDPHFYMRTTILTSGSKLTPKALRESHAD